MSPASRPTMPLWLLRPLVRASLWTMDALRRHADAVASEAMRSGTASQKRMSALLEDTIAIKQQIATPPPLLPVVEEATDD